MRLVIDTGEIHQFMRVKVKRLRERLDPYRRFPTVLKCHCGHITRGDHGPNYSTMITSCEVCGGENPRVWEYDYLTWTPPPKKWRYPGWDEGKKFMWWRPHHIDRREREWARLLRELDRARARDRRAGILIPRLPGRRAKK